MAEEKDAMKRSGTVTLLGAGASAEAGYPTADQFLALFRAVLEDESRQERVRHGEAMRQRAELERQAQSPTSGQSILLPPMRDEPTTADWFNDVWGRFAAVAGRLRPLAVPQMGADGRPQLASPVVYGHAGIPSFPPWGRPSEGEPVTGREPYLETFFAFHDDYLRPIIVATQGDPGKLISTQYRLRRLRDFAVRLAFRELSAHRRSRATYLQPILNLPGPASYRSAIATLNLDVAIEQLASDSGIVLSDGFDCKPHPAGRAPEGWREANLTNPLSLWETVSKNGFDFIGFDSLGEGENLLLKLHGSLGWYTMEEGHGDIGSRDELRHNAIYRHFRLPYNLLWDSMTEGLVDQMANGGPSDPVTQTSEGSISRKAGAIWIRPELVFARALKAHPDRLSLAVMKKFTDILDKAANVMVVGYSWGDPHVNDMVLEGVAGGTSLINVSLSALPEDVLALWIHRFPTTFHILQRRLFMFGGGAKRVFADRIVMTSSGQQLHLDLIDTLARGLPAELSLERTLPARDTTT